jgi:hypothetical protein
MAVLLEACSRVIGMHLWEGPELFPGQSHALLDAKSPSDAFQGVTRGSRSFLAAATEEGEAGGHEISGPAPPALAAPR